MKLDVKIKMEVHNGYTITWYDTLGKYMNLSKFNRPYEINCDILDQNDTAGYYHGMSNPSTWTSLGQKTQQLQYIFILNKISFQKCLMTNKSDTPTLVVTSFQLN